MLPNLNDSATRLCDALIRDAAALRVDVHDDGLQVPIIDCGVRAVGSLEAGRRVAEICLAGQGNVEFVPYSWGSVASLAVQIRTDDPVRACLGAQYAGWRISDNEYFAMGSGPMRAVAGSEAIISRLGLAEVASCGVGILEAAQFPPPEVAEKIARECDIEPRRLTLLVARTASLVGTIQVVARSVETALHKLVELDCDVSGIVSARGIAPLPPMGGDDLLAIGRTNDAVLYGSDVTLWIRGDDTWLRDRLSQLPSSGSRDYGRTFRELYESYGQDFYRMDPLLFSPAQISLIHLDSGRLWKAGEIRPDLLERSFASP